MRLFTRATTIVLLSLLGACAGGASPTAPLPLGNPSAETSADDSGDAATALVSGKPVTFKGRFDGMLTSSIELVFPVVSNMIEASGHASRFGQFTVTIPHVVNTATQEADGGYQFTMAKGDTLTATFTGQGSFIENGVITVVDTAAITGGTGRFTGATGTLTVTREFTVATNEISATFSGTLVVP